MDISRLKSLRAGNKAAVTKVFKKLEEAIGDSEIDTEEVSTLLEAIEKKKKTLASIDEQILNAVESEDITNEILETDEYYLDLEGKIRKFKKFLKPVPKSNIFDTRFKRTRVCSVHKPIYSHKSALSQSSSTSKSGYGDYTQTYSTATPSANFITGVKRVTTDKTRPINTTDKSLTRIGRNNAHIVTETTGQTNVKMS
ncbi:Hypothetical predicted protein [Mytilus galloprovincialis]|uniref:Uncharacterized protein n=1 Tax=Mytilus galloprovincialis TaxID=29158 RepID=A0A8B6HDY1_MYTGA|nr:Hypothetical predicted protein [Mytilus galloprovincialis]